MMDTTEFLNEFQTLLATDPNEVEEAGYAGALWLRSGEHQYCPITYMAMRKQAAGSTAWRTCEYRRAGESLDIDTFTIETISVVADYPSRQTTPRLRGILFTPDDHRKLRRRLQYRIRKAMAARKGGRP